MLIAIAVSYLTLSNDNITFCILQLLEDARQSGALAQAQDKKAAHEDNTSHEVSALPPPDIAAPRPVATPTPHQTFKRNLAAALVGLEKKIPVGVSDRGRFSSVPLFL